MKKTILVIAGTSVTIQTDEAMAFFLAPLKEFYRGFLKPRGPATAQVTISYNPLVTYRKFKTFPVSLQKKRDVKTVQIFHHVETL